MVKHDKQEWKAVLVHKETADRFNKVWRRETNESKSEFLERLLDLFEM